MDAIEQYDFYFRSLCFTALHANESKEKSAKMKSIINLKFQLVDVAEAHVDYDTFEEDLKAPFDDQYESKDFESSIIRIELKEYEKISGIKAKNRKELMYHYECGERNKVNPDYLIE